MTLEEQLNYCRVCQNRKLNPQIGLVCSLTDEKPTFEKECPDFNFDQSEAEHLANLERQAEVEDSEGGMFAPERQGVQKGVVGGIVMIIISAVWFFGGMAAGIIFYYPPILFAIGCYALIKGLVTGNISGKNE